jgi:hypothetical protein
MQHDNNFACNNSFPTNIETAISSGEDAGPATLCEFFSRKSSVQFTQASNSSHVQVQQLQQLLLWMQAVVMEQEGITAIVLLWNQHSSRS